MFVLILLTQLDGKPIWVESTQVQIIRQATKQCHAPYGAGIQVGAVSVCVKETPDQIREKIKGAK